MSYPGLIDYQLIIDFWCLKSGNVVGLSGVYLQVLHYLLVHALTLPWVRRSYVAWGGDKVRKMNEGGHIALGQLQCT